MRGENRMTTPNLPDEPSRSHSIPYFDGLRGLGALVVFLNHMGMSRLLPAGAPVPIGFLTNGAFAVDIFFTLSGYVMAMLTSRTRETLVAISTRRYVRLALPAAASCVFSAYLLAMGLYYNRSLAAQNGSLWLDGWFQFAPSYWGALHEGFIGIFYAPTSIYNSSLWTLYYELWCSLAIFLGAYLGRWWWLPLGVGAATIYHFGANDLAAPICFAAGAFAFRSDAFFQKRFSSAGVGPSWRWTIYTLTTIVIVLAFYFATYPRFPTGELMTLYSWLPAPIVDVWGPCAAGILTVIAVHKSKPLSRIFSLRPMLFLGRHSFAIYLVHLPIICSLGAWLAIILDSNIKPTSVIVFKLALTLNFFAIAAAVLVVAIAFSRFIDKPSIRFGHWLSHTFDQRFFYRRVPLIEVNYASNEPLRQKDRD